jgi:uncharacterized RDD family membrane protein YckC
MEWYVSRGGEKEGPFTAEQIRQLAELGKLQPDFLVWRTGMEQWKPIAEVPGILTPPPLEQPANAVPIEKLKQSTSDQLLGVQTVKAVSNEVAQVRPWVRYWARMFDIYVFSIIVGIVLAMLAPRFLSQGSNEYLLGMVIVFLWVFVEALLISAFGTTPGKWLLKVKIGQTLGEPINFSQALNRSLKVWWRGLGTGFPFATLITLAIQHGRLKNNGITSWDREGDFVIAHEKIGVVRVCATVIFFFLFFLLIAVANAT